METTDTTKPVPVPVADLKKELALKDPATIVAAPASDKELDSKADAFVSALLELKAEDPAEAAQGRDAASAVGADVQKKAARASEMLKQPLSTLAKRAEDGGPVAKSLVDLKMQVEELDPGKIDFEAGWLTRTLGRLPGVGSPLKRYFTKYESAQTVISTVVRSLTDGKEQLGRDNTTLSEDQKNMRDMTFKLERAISLGKLIDAKLQYKLDRETEPGTPRQKFIAEELLFPLRQRIMDLQQQLAVNQQGVLALEVIMRNNKELMRGVDRAVNVTVTALQVAVTVALALENQKVVLDKIDAVSKTTSDLIAGTAARLKTQGVEIHKRAASTTLNMESLKTAFNDVRSALDDLSSFRQNALPQMASQIVELDKMSTNIKGEIEKMESAKVARPELKIDVG
jgi:uncharacterized protein YaaN involved in tellurite resistance